jgi:drug/metabolite transporter (DMT)-like permease
MKFLRNRSARRATEYAMAQRSDGDRARLQPSRRTDTTMNDNASSHRESRLAPSVSASGVARVFAPSASLLGGLFVVLWASAFVAGKVGLQSTGPLTMLVIRFAVAALVLLPIAVLSRAAWPRKAIDYVHLAVAGLLVNAATLACIYVGLTLGVSAGTSALVAGTAPLFTALGAGPVLDEKIENHQWVGMLIGLGGVALVVLNKISLAGATWEGYALTFIAVGAFVAGTLYQKRFVKKIDLSSGNFVQFAVATAVVFPLAVHFEGLQARWNGDLIACALWMAIVNSVCGLGLLYLLLRRGKASQVSTLFLLVPGVAAAMGFIAFHETLGPLTIGGFIIAASGVYLGSRKTA